IAARTRYVLTLRSPVRTQPSASKQRRSLHCLAKSVPGNTAKLGCCALPEAVSRIKIQSRQARARFGPPARRSLFRSPRPFEPVENLVGPRVVGVLIEHPFAGGLGDAGPGRLVL